MGQILCAQCYAAQAFWATLNECTTIHQKNFCLSLFHSLFLFSGVYFSTVFRRYLIEVHFILLKLFFYCCCVLLFFFNLRLTETLHIHDVFSLHFGLPQNEKNKSKATLSAKITPQEQTECDNYSSIFFQLSSSAVCVCV